MKRWSPCEIFSRIFWLGVVLDLGFLYQESGFIQRHDVIQSEGP